MNHTVSQTQFAENKTYICRENAENNVVLAVKRKNGHNDEKYIFMAAK